MRVPTAFIQQAFTRLQLEVGEGVTKMKAGVCPGVLCLARNSFGALGAREISLQLLVPFTKHLSSVLDGRGSWVPGRVSSETG